VGSHLGTRQGLSTTPQPISVPIRVATQRSHGAIDGRPTPLFVNADKLARGGQTLVIGFETSALPVRVDAPTDPANLAPNEADLFMSTVDAQGRLALRGPASTMHWTTGQQLWLTRRDGGLLLSRLPPSHLVAAMAVALDSRLRVLLPYFIRVQNNWEPRGTLMVLAAPVQGVLAAVPVARVAAVGEVGWRGPMDAHGRLPLRGPAPAIGRLPDQDLTLVVGVGVLHFSAPAQPAQPRTGVTVVLDSRWRILLPYGIGVHRGPEFGICLTVIAAPMEGLAAALPRYCRW
jgi:hypothetical protein